ncbi:serine hydrolase domain-containing protein [Actinoplanes sp. NPDC049118]|uniref:serine hydrolase domain-containing protein n=1 Tax=Actinoplanes sp. NPDC049118 TaxID=3155769 RepID=UPI0033ECACBD
MTRLPRSTPAAQGVDASGIDAFITALDRTPDVELHSLMVLRHGHVVAERWWHPYRPDAPHLLYSLSKSFASTALGFAVTEGLVDLDATVLSYFPEYDARVTDPRSRSILVRHVASMTSGHADETIDEAFQAGAGDLTLGLLLLPPQREPGTFFAYNQPCTNALSAIIERVSGASLTEFLRPRLFEPLGIGRYGWWPDPIGRDQGFSGLHLTTESVAKVGQLYLDGGSWQGRRLLPAEWVAEATRAHVDTDRDSPDWSRGYGFQFWRSRHGYRGDGAHGQYMLILPEADAVVAITSQSPDMQAVLDQAWTHLLPALTRSGPPGPWPAGSPELDRPAGDGSTGELAEATYRPGPANTVDTLKTVRLRPGEILLDDGWELTAELGAPDSWTVVGPVATAHAWSGGRLLVDLVFTEGPHRLHLTLDPATGTFAAAWQAAPLAPVPLAAQRMPR